ncbi:GNAT family N-acetyltransferase [Streptomyces sp. NBC_01433]|uniref:GNAT family N-acetyltransferase n=1 Tax=Streptomyces sp. NBC_01433 TaxID=2903864 RepID=UPI00225A63AF|nr:GNAT family N-acetyltransferase [Streptomyces sp. NBC_01433]MCX4682069.1 GNAT family N-acetyltransferase [Streptomyces sp. NBC_01433]
MQHIHAAERGPAPSVRIARARYRDLEAVTSLLSLVNPGQPVPDLVGVALSFPPGRLTHGDCLCLIARVDGRIVGALMASPPNWTETHPLRGELVRSVLYIGGVAVAPDHRGKGIASALLRAAEQHSRSAGLRLLTLEHPSALTRFYTRHGYTAGQDCLLVALPNGVQVRRMPGHQTAVKPLTLAVRIAQVPGAPAGIVSGLIEGCDVPPSARFGRNGLIT